MASRVRRTTAQVFAFGVASAAICVVAIAPTQRDAPAAFAAEGGENGASTQILTVDTAAQPEVQRDTVQVIRPVVVPPPPAPEAAADTSPARKGAPAAGVPDPGTAKSIAFDMVAARGWGTEQYDCLVSLWQRESGWNAFANNPSSGAYGIPQSLPGSKMASAGADWATNPATQITWGLGYIAGRYSTPCGAWGASQSKGWY